MEPQIDPLAGICSYEHLSCAQQLEIQLTPALAEIDDGVRRLDVSDSASARTVAVLQSLSGFTGHARHCLQEIGAARSFSVDAVIIIGALFDLWFPIDHALAELRAIGDKLAKRSQLMNLDDYCGEIFSRMNRIHEVISSDMPDDYQQSCDEQDVTP